MSNILSTPIIIDTKDNHYLPIITNPIPNNTNTNNTNNTIKNILTMSTSTSTNPKSSSSSSDNNITTSSTTSVEDNDNSNSSNNNSNNNNADSNSCNNSTTSTTEGNSALISADMAKRFLPAYKKANAALTFPEKMMNLMKYVEDRNKTDKDFCISWLPEGKAFVIYNIKEFTNSVIPKFFKASKFCSFTRKLYRWGFRQLNRGIGPDEPIIFGNEFFQRDDADLMVNMRSITAASIRKRESDLLRHMLASKKRALMSWDVGGGNGGGGVGGHNGNGGHHQDPNKQGLYGQADPKQLNMLLNSSGVGVGSGNGNNNHHHTHSHSFADQKQQNASLATAANAMASQQRYVGMGGGVDGVGGGYTTELSHLNNQQLQMLYRNCTGGMPNSSSGGVSGGAGGDHGGGGGSIVPIISDAVSQMNNLNHNSHSHHPGANNLNSPYSNFVGSSGHVVGSHQQAQQDFTNQINAMSSSMPMGVNSSTMGGLGGVGPTSNYMQQHMNGINGVGGQNGGGNNNSMHNENGINSNNVGGGYNGLMNSNGSNMFSSAADGVMYGNSVNNRNGGRSNSVSTHRNSFNLAQHQFNNNNNGGGVGGGENSITSSSNSNSKTPTIGVGKHNFNHPNGGGQGDYSSFNNHAPTMNSMNINQHLFNLSSSSSAAAAAAAAAGSEEIYFGGQY